MIFLVDDDPIQNMLTSQLIKMTDVSSPYEIFSNGAEALEGLKEGKIPNLILLDINMPIMNGWEFLNEYDLFEKKGSVFMLTSSMNDEDRNKSKNYGCVTGYYPKPVNLDSIKEIISQVSF